MKNVFIGGVSRSGKSTLSRRLFHEQGYNVFELDTVVHALTKTHPELGISEKRKDLLDQNFAPLAFELFKGCVKDLKFGGIKTVVNGFHLMPQTMAKCPNLDNWIVIYLGVADLSEAEFVKVMRSTQTDNDWTAQYSNEQLAALGRDLILRSQEIERQCQAHNFFYFNTGLHRPETLTQILTLLQTINK